MTMSPRIACLCAIAYADVFDFALRPSEIVRWSPIRIAAVPRVLQGTRRVDGHVVLEGRKHIVALRFRRHTEGGAKWRLARVIAGYFRHIPSVMLCGVTGALSVDNASEDDDIDLFFVTAPGTLWVTRFLVTAFSDMFRLRRRPNELRVRDKVCLNMFMDAGALGIPQEERDYFSAHETLQMVPLWERDNTYIRFLDANAWVKTFFPSAWVWRRSGTTPPIREVMGATSGIWLGFFRMIEPFFRRMQLRYMEPRRTTEVVSRNMLRFHPQDARRWVRKKFAVRLRKFGVPLDNIFYSPLK